MRRASGRVAIGLVLLSTWAGACLSEQDKGEIVGVPAPQSAGIRVDELGARDVVFAVRSQLEQAFGKSMNRFGGARIEPSAVGRFDRIGFAQARESEELSFGGAPIEGIKARSEMTLPTKANGAFHLRDAGSGMAIDVALLGATSATREDINGYVVYRAGYEDDAHIVHRPTDQGTEDYVYFPQKLPAVPELRYDLRLGDNVAGLRLVAQTIEMLDSTGAPRLRMAPPYAVDGDGRRVAVNVAIEGCAYDSSDAMPWDRPIVQPGASHCTVKLSWDSNVRAPLVVDPVWSNTREMAFARFDSTVAEFLQNNRMRVIVVGGDPGDPSMAHDTTEIFDEATNSWAAFKILKHARTQHAMVSSLQSNAPLISVIGGRNGTGVLASVETIDLTNSAAADWTVISPMTSPRAMHTANLVDGQPPRIFVAGGINNDDTVLNTMEVLTIGPNATWQLSPNQLNSPRMAHTASIGKPGKVVILGGKSTMNGAGLASGDYCEVGILPPACSLISTDAFHPRAHHKAVREEFMENGSPKVRLYFIGGETGTTKVVDVDVFEATSGIWPDPPANIGSGRSFLDAMLVSASPIIGIGRKIVVTGGYDSAGEPSNSVEWLDTMGPIAGKTWVQGPGMLKGRARHSMAKLADGRILVIGGVDAPKVGAEVLQCSANSDCPATAPFCADGFCCNTECDGICEACNGPMPGTCMPVSGEPREGHGTCVVPNATENDQKCIGKCDGFTRDACEYQEGKSCGIECVDDLPDRVVPSTTTELVCSAEGRCVKGPVSATCGAYTCGDANSCRVDCKDTKECVAGHVCSSGQCIPGQTMCSNADGLENNVVVSTIPGKEDVRCEPYRCVAGACTNVCETAYDCLPKKNEEGVLVSYACDANRTCVPVDETISENEMSCSTAPANESSRFGWLAAVALAGFVAARRKRARA